MSAIESQVSPEKSIPVEITVDNITDTFSKVLIQPDHPEDSTGNIHNHRNDHKNRPLVIYSRPQLLYLHKSPLVKLPPGMPALKDWFGAESEMTGSKKDADVQPSPNNARDRRFRRDAEDGEAPSRPTFRGTTITQPSQMGNFKHQSIRAADRDRDKEADRDQERETRVKEGQERLRHLSDKYDRDRRALSSGTALRGKDRDLAPHLPTGTSSRITSQSQTTAARQTDVRDHSKRKEGEISEDWRRGSEPARAGRGDRPDNLRRDREDRERPRSRVRDSSRSRRESSVPRREGDRDRREDSARDGYSHRRDKDDVALRERDRDGDKDSEADDPRRWRDDGKRDERVAARRDREHREKDRDIRDRPRDRVAQAPAWESNDRQDRRWAGAEDRDGRTKRNAGRDRRIGGDDTKDDRREREREKEPAWMDTYIPGDSNNGFHGASKTDGDLDGIQAFKKELKDKELKEQAALDSTTQRSEEPKPKDAASGTSDSPLDEIQLFKLMMKREEEKKRVDQPFNGQSIAFQASGSNVVEGTSDVEGSVSLKDLVSRRTPRPNSSLHPSTTPSPNVVEVSTHSQPDTPNTLLSIFSSSPSPNPNVPRLADLDISSEKSKASGSRFFPHPVASDLPAPQPTMKPSMDAIAESSHVSTLNNPPSGSRLLAFASRLPPNADNSRLKTPPANSVQHKNSMTNVGVMQNGNNPMFHHNDNPPSALSPNPDGLRPQGLSPLDEVRDRGAIASPSEVFRRGSAVSSGDRTSFYMEQLIPNDMSHGVSPNNLHGVLYEPAGSGVAAAKGSRFAKFFDGRGRDSPVVNKASGGGVGHPASRQELSNFTGMPGGNPDARAMEDIFAMLSNSAHGQRINPIELAAAEAAHLNAPSNTLQALQNTQFQHHHQHVQNNGRMDALYDSRLDDRNFVPDGMVPGLRSVPPPRSRQNSAMFTDGSDEVPFNGPRVQSQMYSGPVPSMYPPQGMGRNGGIAAQPPHYRGGPSPNPLQGPAQRLPPGLANLGGRPPHEPAQFISPGMGLPSSGLHGLPHGNGPAPQNFNNFPQSNIGFGGGPQMRGPHPNAHQLQNVLGHNALQGPGHYGNLNAAQAQLLGINGGIPNGLRGPGGGYGQQGPQMQLPIHAMRQQQQQLPPHLASLHYQQQGLPGANNQPAHDLMALLMSGRRD
ncbi:hypothetical protein BJ138DRAFT_1141973 [Hygrophoropsis aurantiaca]|uniref:Uncharacterized protein n=1 Tax=Hygrophoropsis aurantiaca TaxID=72124 RepID=A0ACB8AQY6_9AGAM|nr:hypothetical protein BJ138DRAFT_1141973 [Hygrophoropsis aurantiaca]